MNASGRIEAMFLRRPPRVPDPGQKVMLLGPDGVWRGGFRAVSGPLSARSGGIIIRVAEEGEYRWAKLEGRPAVSMPWPLEDLKVEE